MMRDRCKYLFVLALAAMLLAWGAAPPSSVAQEEPAATQTEAETSAETAPPPPPPTFHPSPARTRRIVRPPVVLPENAIAEIVMVQWANPVELAETIRLFNVEATAAGECTRAIVLRGAPEAVKAAKEAARQLDLPPQPAAAQKDIELTIYLIMAGKADTPLAGEPCPAQVQDAVNQIKEVFGFQSTALLDTFLLRGREGSRIELNGVLKPFEEQPKASDSLIEKIASLTVQDPKFRQELLSLVWAAGSPATYSARVDSVSASNMADGEQLIRLDEFTFACDCPAASSQGRGVVYQQMGIKADLDVREGQLAVVGKASLATSGQTAFVVISGRVLPN